MAVKVSVRHDALIEWLDKMEGGKLFPQIAEEDEVTAVEVGYLDVTFTVGEDADEEAPDA